MSASTDHEAIVIKVWTDRGPIDVINYYNPCGKLSQDKLEVVGGSSLDRVLWCGEFNSHNSLWGSNGTDAKGTVIEEFIEYHNLVCINSGEGTRYNSRLLTTDYSSDVWGMIRRMGGIRWNYEIPVLSNGDTMVVGNVEKAELLAITFKKVHSSENLSEEARQCRIRTVMKNPRIVDRAEMSGDPLDLHFSMFELKKAIARARQTTPGKDGVCYAMFEHTLEKGF